MSNVFFVQPARYTFEARQPIAFAPGMAGNTFRGAFGMALRLLCAEDCPGSAQCRLNCSYREIFAPQLESGPSGLRQPPRPFVLRAPELEGRTFKAGERLTVGLHLFRTDARQGRILDTTMTVLGRQGLGPTQTRLDLVERVWHNPVLTLLSHPQPASRVRIDFLTPTELKQDGQLVREPSFEVLFARIRDRVSALSSLYAGAPLVDVDYAGLAQRAAAVRLLTANLNYEKLDRRSRRTGQTHPIGGFTGQLSYEGDLAEFRPWLEAATWAGVGRHTVWGNGALSLTWNG